MPINENPSRAVSRPKVFLIDLEYAKKEEFERRRKLRLKQVRQQARDIASIIRNQTRNSKTIDDDLKKSVRYESNVRLIENRKKELQEELTECLESVGTAHSSAAILAEVDELMQHKIELQDTLARVRAELAKEKAKEYSKPRTDIVTNPSEGVIISKVNVTKPPLRPGVKKIAPPKNVSSLPPTPPNLIGTLPPLENAESGKSRIEQAVVQPPVESTIFSPPMLSDMRSRLRVGKTVESSVQTDGRKSCPPMTNSIEALDSESDESDRSWPPASVKKKKSSKVRFYDHSARKCSDYVQQCGIIRMESPEPSSMKRLIEEEENLLSQKMEKDLENRRTELQRGMRALREEMAKQDFDLNIKDLCQSNKEKRLKKAQNYQAPAEDVSGVDALHTEERRVSGQALEPQSSQKETAHKGQGDNKTHRPPINVLEEPVSAMVSKLTEKRESILNEQSVDDEESLAESDEDTEDEISKLPLWLKAEFDMQDNICKGEIAPNRAVTPETAVGSMNGAGVHHNDGSAQENGSSTAPMSDEKAEKSDTSSDKSEQGDKKRVGFHPNKVKSVEVGGSNATASSQSSTSGEINVQIKISKEKPPGKRLSFQTPTKDSGSSTSYYSPPDKLSPQQVSVLSDILSKMSVKNRNPVLHHYITRMLNMSHRSLSELEVSGCSDFSIPSEVCSHSRESTPGRNGFNSRGNIARKMPCFKELDNLSTVGTVSSTPRASSFENAPTPNHSEQIADLLRNIIDLQRLYNANSSSDPSCAQLSESQSSYQSVPVGMDADHYHDVAPPVRDGVKYCEDTGIFNIPRRPNDSAHGSADRPSLASILNSWNLNINVPSKLYPKPFANTEGKEVPRIGERDQVLSRIDQRIADGPDGYSMRPEWDPTSNFMIQRNNRQVITSLSDIESVVSSIQSTPTKMKSNTKSTSLSRSPPQGSIDEVSDISSSEFISSREMLNNDLIESSSSSSDVEDVFRSLGLGWALSTLRRTRDSKNLRSADSTSKSGSLLSSERSKNVTTYHHSTPMKQQTPPVILRPRENDQIPSLTPPSITLNCPSWQK